MSDSDSGRDVSTLAREVIDELDSGRYGDKFVFTRRQVIALAGAGLSVGALTTLGVDEATAQEAVGQVGTESDPVDVKAANVDANSVSTESLVNDWHFAGSFDGGSATDRLETAIDQASEGDAIYLENTSYGSITISKRRLSLIGTQFGPFDHGTYIDGTWTVDGDSGQVLLKNISIGTSESELVIEGDRTVVETFGMRFSSNEITVDADGCLLYGLVRGEGAVTLTDGTSDNVVGIRHPNMTVTDNGDNSVMTL